MLYLNDWSLNTTKSNETLLFHWEKVEQFRDLAKFLCERYNVGQIAVTQNIYSLSLCNIPITEVYNNESKVLTVDNRILLLGIFDRFFHVIEEQPILTFCSNIYNKNVKSALLALAATDSGITISFVFDSCFEKDILLGYLENNPTKEISLDNYYVCSKINPVNLISKEECEKHNPLEEPMWNISMMKNYLESIGHKRERHSKDEREKIQYIKTHSKILAQLNGWCIDETLTKINTWDGHPRQIYRSTGMHNKNFYLSVDFEKEDFHFELHNYKGFHLKEVNWMGEDTDVAKADHKIKMKR